MGRMDTKYLGVLESDGVSCEQMEKLKQEYKRRLKKILRSKLSGGNIITAVNTWAVSLIRYAAPFVEWRRDELKEMDRSTRKVMNMYRALHPRDSVARLYLPRKEGGRELLSIEDSVDLAILGLENYVQQSDELLHASVRAAVKESETVKEFKKRRKEERRTELKEKALHGQFFRQTQECRDEETWRWLKAGELEKETEGLLMAAQTQSLRTNAIKAKIDKSQDDPNCRMCKQSEETVCHITSQCPKLAQKEYKRRHDCVARSLHWNLCKQNAIECCSKWYEQQPDSVIETEQVRILWDFTIQTDNTIQARRPDVVIVNKIEKTCHIVDVAIPGDERVLVKETEKIEKYDELRRELERLWKVKAKVVPIIVGALGTVTRNLNSYLKEIGVNVTIQLIQKSALLGTARILRKVVDV